VHVDRNGAASPLEVRAGVTRDDREPEWLSVRQLTAKRSDIAFKDLDAGHYTIVVAGPRPLQRASVHAVVARDDRRKVTIAIRPQPMHGRITLGGAPLANATVTLRGRDFTTTTTTDANGAIGGPLWQGGDFDAIVESPRLGAPLAAAIRIANGQFKLDIESRVVRGVVRDVIGKPIANASVVLRSGDDAHPVTRRTTTDAHGAYRIDGVAAGPQLLQASAPGYLRGEPLVFTASARETMRNAALDPGVRRTIEVTDSSGQRVEDAIAVCATGNTIHSLAYTDVLGRAVVAMPRSGDAMLYVVPLTGSIVTHRLVRGTGVEPLRIPPANASLQVDALVTDGTPLSGVWLLVRYNGVLIPPEVARMLAGQQQMKFVTDERGRVVLPHVAPGTYELWPYRSDAEAESLIASASEIAAPINLKVTPGENHATVRFKKRH
jgi:hypothetical protein